MENKILLLRFKLSLWLFDFKEDIKSTYEVYKKLYDIKRINNISKQYCKMKSLKDDNGNPYFNEEWLANYFIYRLVHLK